MPSNLPSGRAGVARTFVDARRAGRPLTRFPGAKPHDLASAYRIQDEAIDLWGEPVAGWKVGRINPPWTKALNGGDRLIGPIFASRILDASAQRIDAPVFAGGFIAVEAEFVIMLGADAAPNRRAWPDDELMALIADVRVGVEIASSPYAAINADGPLVTIADFGNNAGLLIGAELAGWRGFDLKGWSAQTHIDGQLAGAGAAADLPGGPLASLRAALNICAARGRRLRKGMAISTGAISGVHEARIGQSADVSFGGGHVVRCTLTPAKRDPASAGSS